MSYPFYLAENLTPVAVAGDYRSFTSLVERNFAVIMKSRDQTPTVKWLRVAQLQAHITRAVLRAGGQPQELFALSQSYLERISRLPVQERSGLKQLLMEYCQEALSRLTTSPPHRPELAQRFLSLVERSDLRGLNVAFLAHSLKVTPPHLCRVVRQATGQTPREHIRRFRLERGRHQLGLDSVTAAALDSGFNKVSTFIAQFRREYGETPGMYKRRLRQAADSQPVVLH